jgi:hypothetical protein
MRYSFIPRYTADTGQQAGNNADKQDEAPAEKLFTQADLEAKIDERLKRQRQAFEAQKREEQAALELKQMEDQKQFEELAKVRAEEVKSLKPRADLADGYEKAVARLLVEQTKSLPSAIQTLLNKLSLIDQLDWLAANASNITPASASGNTDINAYTRNSGAGALTNEEIMARKRASGLYG